MVVIADQSKKVNALGKFPLPVEVVPFGVNATAWKIERALKLCDLKGKQQLRLKDGKPFVTDSGNAIIDVTIGNIPEPRRLDNLIKSIPGVVDHGLFIDICGIIMMGTDDGVQIFRKG
jgi:ribose 5-phosphate isomerase A